MRKIKTSTNCQALARPIMTITMSVLEEVFRTVGQLPAESGGILGGEEGSSEITEYHFDATSENSRSTYSPNYEEINRILIQWNRMMTRLIAILHSHPGTNATLSAGDGVYALKILQAIKDLDELWLPIVNTIPDTGAFTLTPWLARLVGDRVEILRGNVCVIAVPGVQPPNGAVAKALDVPIGTVVDAITITVPERPVALENEPESKESKASAEDVSEAPPEEPERSRIKTAFDVHKTFDRVQDAYDLDCLRASRLIIVGAGGASAMVEDCVRAGVGQFVLIDPDTVSESNLATQQTYRRDIGRPKVNAIGDRIRDINPTAAFKLYQKRLDEISPEELRRLTVCPIDGCFSTNTVVCGLTDDFLAQSQVNRLALHLGIPSLCAGVYKEGRGAEVTFTYPGVTPACHRCILRTRYEYFLDQKHANHVTSHGTPIFSTTRLNAIKGFLLMALLHHGSSHPRWGNMLSRIGDRNLVQIRLDPDIAETVGLGMFDKVFADADRERLFFDEVVWLPQRPEDGKGDHPRCPDCGGTGDLTLAAGTLANLDPSSPRSRSLPVTPLQAPVGVGRIVKGQRLDRRVL